MTTPKKTSVSSCRKKEFSKMTDVGKLIKKVERLRNRIFPGERAQSTFVPSSQQQQPQQHQNSATQSTSSAGSSDHGHPQMPHQPVLVNPPYPVHPGFGTGFPQYPYPQQPHFQQQPSYPPSYGWALNSAAAAAANDHHPTPSTTAFGALSLDVGVGNETAGSGFDHLSGHHHHQEEQHGEPNYLRPDVRAISELRKAQSAKLEAGKQQVLDEVKSLNFAINDVKELQKWFEDKFPHTLVKDESTTEELEVSVRRLEEKLKKLRAKSPSPGERPIRPPKPRSYSQESSTAPWTCDRCSTENRPYTYRCKQCNLPSHRFDPQEIEFCGCENCATAATTGNSA